MQTADAWLVAIFPLQTQTFQGAATDRKLRTEN